MPKIFKKIFSYQRSVGFQRVVDDVGDRRGLGVGVAVDGVDDQAEIVFWPAEPIGDDFAHFERDPAAAPFAALLVRQGHPRHPHRIEDGRLAFRHAHHLWRAANNSGLSLTEPARNLLFFLPCRCESKRWNWRRLCRRMTAPLGGGGDGDAGRAAADSGCRATGGPCPLCCCASLCRRI